MIFLKKNDPKSPALLLITRANADFQMKNGKAEAAAGMLEDLRRSSPGDALVTAQLISAYATFDTKKAQTISKDLPSVETIVKGESYTLPVYAWCTLLIESL